MNNRFTISPKAFQTLLNTLKKSFPQFSKSGMLGTTENDLKEILKANGISWESFKNGQNEKANLQTVNDTFNQEYEGNTDVNFLKTSKGEVYGAVFPNGQMWIDGENMNANTPIHEFSHIWEKMMPLAWKKGLEIFKQTKTGKEYFNTINKNKAYNNLSEDQKWSEAMNTHIGDLGEQKYNNPKGKMAEFQQWVKDVFLKIGQRLKLNFTLTPETTYNQFANGVLGDLLGGKELKTETAQKSGNTNYSYLQPSDFDANGNVKPEVLAEIKAERENIISEAKANGSYMKAPNGEKTKLNEEQWADVRTSRFKNWFGDWEAEAENIASKGKVEQLLKADKDTSKGVQRETIGRITSEQADVLKNDLGINPNGYKHTIEKSMINHTINNHGNEKIEAQRGQIAVTEEDFTKIPEVLNNPDKIEYSGKNDKGLDTIKYTKAFNGTTIVVEEVRTGKKELAFNTMYKHKTGSEQLNKPSFPTPETTSRSKDTKSTEVSKVVDDNGEPMVVYHGTSVEFNDFAVSENGDFGKGIYFGTTEEEAKSYAKIDREMNGRNIKNERIVSGFLNLKKPYTPTNSEWKKSTFDSFYDENGKEIDTREKLEERGFDGVIIMGLLEKDGRLVKANKINKENVLEIVAFSPNQIKSATSNQGTYSEDTGNINFHIVPNQDDNQNQLFPKKELKDFVKSLREGATTKEVLENIKQTDYYKGLSFEDKEMLEPSNIPNFIKDQLQQHKEQEKQESKANNPTTQATTQSRKNNLVSERIKPAKRRPQNPIRKITDIAKDVAQGLKVTMVNYKPSGGRNTLGTYNPSNTLLTIKNANDLDTIAHELGHALDDRFDLLGKIPPALSSQIEQELCNFVIIEREIRSQK